MINTVSQQIASKVISYLGSLKPEAVTEKLDDEVQRNYLIRLAAFELRISDYSIEVVIEEIQKNWKSLLKYW